MLRWNRVPRTVLLTTLGIGLSAGCKLTAELAQPITIAPAQPANAPAPAKPAPETALQRPEPTPAGVPNGLTLFGDRPELEHVPFENRLVTNLHQHSFTTEGLDFDPDVCDAEDLLVFASTRNSQHPDIFLKRIDGITLTQLTADPADDIQPRFSPDGERIAFASNRSGNWDVWIINRNGIGLTQLTADRCDDVAPCWSPDGTQIAYTVWGERSHRWEIWTLSVGQPGTRRFLACGMFPAWSPDGRRLAFQRARQRGDRLFSVWTIDLDAGEARHPTEIAHSDTAACIAPRWSPDGSMIAYCGVRHGVRLDAQDRSTPPAADLWVVELETGLRMKLTDGAEADFNPVWADNGRIFFVSARAGTENIWSLTITLGSYAERDPLAPQVSRSDVDLSSDVTKD